MKYSIKNIVKFTKKVSGYVLLNTDDCIEYPYKTLEGYGTIQCREDGVKAHYVAHRVVYALFHDIDIPDDKVIMHSCDNPPCCNPRHLKLGTHNDNCADKVNKGRQAKGKENGKYIHGRYTKEAKEARRGRAVRFKKGHAPKNSTLTIDEAKKVKKAIINRTTTLKKVAEEFNISYSLARDISSGRSYINI